MDVTTRRRVGLGGGGNFRSLGIGKVLGSGVIGVVRRAPSLFEA